MPVNKVAVVHKFGIISPSHRLELQKRLAEKTKLLKAKNEGLIKASKNPLEVTEEFVLAYNAPHDLKKREKLDDRAGKMLEKLKRQVGLKTGGVGNHVDLPIAWTDLTQLSQCKGHIQQECLDVLMVSLDQSPTSADHIPVLFFLAESILYSLRTDVIYEQYLGSAEVKLLLIGQRVFARLFFHHMCGQVLEFFDLKRRLHTYLDGFLDSQKVYKPYPHILYYVRYMSAVGGIVVGDLAKEEKEEPPKQTTSAKPPPQQPPEQTDHPVEASTSRVSAALSCSIHELAPTLWHSLDVWRCVCQLGGGLSQALSTMQECAMDLAMENWVDVICALDILGDAARSNLETLTALQRIACGIRDEHRLPSRPGTDAEERGFNEDLDPMAETESSPVGSRLPTIVESEVSVRNRVATQQEVGHKGQPDTLTPEAERDWTNSRSRGGVFSSESLDRTRTDVTIFTDKPDTQNSTCDFDSNSSSLPAEDAIVGLAGWRWELALKYIDVLTHIVLWGSTSLIRRQALMGANEVTDYTPQTASIVRSPLVSAGLFDLLFFRTATQDDAGKGGPSDWGWRVRFGALLSLYKIHLCLSKDQAMLGICTVIWSVLERAQQLERDLRVLEALKVAQVDANLENLLYDHLLVTVPSNLGAKVAQGLLSIYLPPLPPPASGIRPQTMSQPMTAVKSETPNNEAISGGQRSRQLLRTSLRDEIMLSTLLYQPSESYEKRNKRRLQYVVEDQWRKELERQTNEEQEAKLKELDEKEKSKRKEQLKK